MMTITAYTPARVRTIAEILADHDRDPPPRRPGPHHVQGVAYVALDCHCRAKGCPGWAIVRDEPGARAYFNRLFGPAA